jgi:hypothetical protein
MQPLKIKNIKQNLQWCLFLIVICNNALINVNFSF